MSAGMTAEAVEKCIDDKINSVRMKWGEGLVQFADQIGGFAEDLDNKILALDAKMEALDAKMEALVAKMEALGEEKNTPVLRQRTDRLDAYCQVLDVEMTENFEKMEAKMLCTDSFARALYMEQSDVKKRTERLEQWCKMLDTQTQAGDAKAAALVDAKKSFVLWHAGLLMLHAVLMGMVFAWSRTA
jgi:hypothetical protein